MQINEQQIDRYKRAGSTDMNEQARIQTYVRRQIERCTRVCMDEQNAQIDINGQASKNICKTKINNN